MNEDFMRHIILKDDKEYKEMLDQILGSYFDFVKEKLNKKMVDSISNIIEYLKLIYEKYFKNDDVALIQNVSSILEILKNNKAFIELKKVNFYNQDANTYNIFYRSRINKDSFSFSKEDLKPISVANNSMVSAQRFSFPGCSCLYAGKSSYVDWLETGKPPMENFYVSSIYIKNTLKILDLAYTDWDTIKLKIENGKSDALDFLLFPLILATSISIEKGNRAFKSEYVISQALMRGLIHFKVQGILYFSSKICRSLKNKTINSCIAIMCPNETLSIRNFIYSSPISMFEFQQIYSPSYVVDIESRGQLYVSIANKFIQYSTTFFYKFDMYLNSMCLNALVDFSLDTIPFTDASKIFIFFEDTLRFNVRRAKNFNSSFDRIISSYYKIIKQETFQYPEINKLFSEYLSEIFRFTFYNYTMIVRSLYDSLQIQ